MILVANDDFTIECDVDDERARTAAQVFSELFSTYQLEDNNNLDPISIQVDGICFLVRYKKLM